MLKKILSTFTLLFIGCLLCYNGQVYAQQFNFSDYIPKSPKSPTAAALGQYGDVPVSYYTGVPDISIPIYDIKVGNVSIPITLSYHASGNKVQDYPSWIGTGWVLNAGGVINRQQRGIIDESMIDNYSSNQSSINAILNSSEVTSFQDPSAPASSAEAMYEYGSNGIGYDTESDIFTCVLPGSNCKFFLDVTGNAHALPANKLKIQATGRIYANQNNLFNDGSGLGNNCFQKFVVTDNDGINYIYGTNTATQAYEVVENSQLTTTQPATINSWFLVEMDLPSGQKINFNYEQATYQIPMAGDVSLMNNGKLAPYTIFQGINSPPSTEKLNGVRLTNITYPGCKIDFISGGYRADLPMDKVLDHINIYNQTNATYNLLKTYQLVTNNPANVVPVQLTDMTNSFRLNLQSVIMYDNSQKQIGAYNLTYFNELSLPRNAPQDFWGYYSGPPLDQLSYLNTTAPDYLKLSNAIGVGVNPAYSQFDILSSITYPTGASSSFTFESNQAIPNDPSIINNVGDLINLPTNQSFNWSLENNTAGNATGFSPEFTTGNTVSGAEALTSAHETPYGDTKCTVLSQCFSLIVFQKNSDGTYPVQGTTIVDQGTMNLTANTTYKVQIKWQTTNQGNAGVGINWQEYPVLTPGANPTKINVGGLRIKQIQNFDPVTNAIITKRYEYLTDAGNCSGTIATLPIYFYYFPIVDVGGLFSNNVYTSTSQNQSSLFNTAGSEIGYSSVTEYNDANGTLGKNVYKFTSNDLTLPGAYPDGGIAASNLFPFPPICSFDWRRGKLLSKYSYVNNNGIYSAVSKTDNSYQFFGSANPDANYLLNTNIKIIKSEVAVFSAPPGSPPIISSHDYIKYPTATEAYYTSSTTQQIFGSQNYQTSTLKTTNNTFDPVSLENSNISSTQSNGNINNLQIQYAADYTTSNAVDDASLGIKNLITNNKLKEPVEELNIVQNTSGQKFVTGGVLLMYYKDKPEISKYYKLNLPAPILLSSFVQSSINAAGNFVYDNTRYELRSSIAYTPGLSPNQVTEDDTKLTAYQWGYNEQYIVAQVSNAKSNDIFYDGFEEGDGTAGVSKTGHYSFNGAYSKTLNNIDPGSYIISYWQYSSGTNTWSLVVNPPITVSGTSYTFNISGQIDDVRFYPAAAQMITYTYDPGIGLTSMTDAKNQVNYYEYDAFQRLINIKDQNGDIMKHNAYHYQGN